MLLSGLIFTKTTIFFFILLIILEIALKWIALYRAWNRKDVWRFICLFIFNTCWILPIIYLLLTSEDVKENDQKEDNIDLPKENNKLKNSNTKPTKKTMKGGVIKWESAMPTKSSKEASSATTKRSTKEKKKLKSKQKN